MKAYHLLPGDLDRALTLVNEIYKGNICFKSRKTIGNSRGGGLTMQFTLTVLSSKGPGHRLSFYRPWSGKQYRLAAACWHVHGDFFDALLEINPRARIITQAGRGSRTNIITKDGGNWTDLDVGSVMYPAYLSELCECDR